MTRSIRQAKWMRPVEPRIEKTFLSIEYFHHSSTPSAMRSKSINYQSILHPVHHDVAVDADEPPAEVFSFSFAVDRQVQAFKQPSAKQDIWGVGEYEGFHDDMAVSHQTSSGPAIGNSPCWPSASPTL